MLRSQYQPSEGIVLNQVFLVVTSINKPSLSMQSLAAGARENKWNFIVVGDRKTPDDYNLPGVSFYSFADQLGERGIAKEIPPDSYARKNLGYLKAIESGANVIVETDDDNAPIDHFFENRAVNTVSQTINNNEWTNIYRFFGVENVWPRGFPLELLQTNETFALENNDSCSPIRQNLINGDTDVDAIYRLIINKNVTFDYKDNIALSPKSWCPFNSQNTTWWKVAFPLMYLPSNCSTRMTDIWRGFIAQKICWAKGWSISFGRPTMFQDRNAHNLISDFEMEIDGYLGNAKFIRVLDSLQIDKHQELIDSIRLCYQTLVNEGFFPTNELKILDFWLTYF